MPKKGLPAVIKNSIPAVRAHGAIVNFSIAQAEGDNIGPCFHRGIEKRIPERTYALSVLRGALGKEHHGKPLFENARDHGNFLLKAECLSPLNENAPSQAREHAEKGRAAEFH